jgi:Tol biopolymer transport system component
MGEVYRARDTRLGRDVAIKISHENFTERFEREARSIAALNHPHICHLYDVGPNFLVMELIEGEPLKGPLPLETVLDYARQIADALEAAHERGIIHRDLKPANILITSSGGLKILDFGLAKSAEAPASDPTISPTITMSPTRAGMILGTAAYMAPEQARGKAVDKRADIWAFGVMLYEMLTGEKLFHGETVSDILAAVLREEPNLSHIPARFRPLIEKCLEKDPKQRLRDIGDMCLLLDRAEPLAASAKSSKWPLAVAALFAMFAIAIGLLYLSAKTLASPPVVRFQVLPPEGNTLGIGFALAPNAKQIAFPATDAKGQSRLWVRSLDSLEARALPGTEGAIYLPWWSPDSRSIGFISGSKLRKIDIAGGPPLALADVPTIVPVGAWSQTGLILLNPPVGPLLKVPDTGGTASPLFPLGPGETSISFPMFLPDGKHFIYARQPGDRARGIYAAAIDSKPEELRAHLLVNAPYAMFAASPEASRGYLLYLRDNTLMAQPFDTDHLKLSGEALPVAEPVGTYITRGLFSVSQNGVLAYSAGTASHSTPVWFDRFGKVLNYPVEPSTYSTIALSPDSSRAVVRRLDPDGRGDLWVFDLVRGGSTRLTVSGTNYNPIWSPDGRRVLYGADQLADSAFYMKDASGAGSEELVFKSHDVNKLPQTWSPDGKFLIYAVQHEKTDFDLWVLPLEGDRKPFPFAETQFHEDEAQFSPDGHWVAYVSDATGASEVYVRPFPPAEKSSQWIISNGGGRQPRWRGDGKELYFLSGRRVMAVDITSGTVFHPSVPRSLFEIALPTGTSASRRDWDVTPDGKRFLINIAASTVSQSPITVVLNWTSVLKK